MANEGSGVGSRPIDLAGDSPELIAFALLRYLAQIEQQDDDIKLDRAWMLDAYAECLEAVKGSRPSTKRKVATKRSNPSS